MLHTKYLTRGVEVDLPEFAGLGGTSDCTFVVEDVYAGGMGLCVHLRHVVSGSHYALKGILPEHLGDEVALIRFYDELQVWLAASMCSLVVEALHVVLVNDVPCVLATWMQGGDLSAALPRLSPSDKFEVVVRTLRGLGWVYENLRVIHRDLKPQNILLDEAGQSYVADWGLSRPIMQAFQGVAASVKSEGIQRPDRTTAKGFLGTVLYAAPEQILDARGVDFKADMYALGCMMFECEAGRPPFLGTTIEEIAYQHLHSPPPTPGGFLKGTKLGLEGIISRCMEKDPHARFASYSELERAVQEVAARRHFSLERCQVAKRYERTILGQGRKQQEKVHASPLVRGTKGYALVDKSKVGSFFEEAENLMALQLFRQAEQLLAPYYIPDVLESPGPWHLGHINALTYAYCLANIEGRLNESLSILEALKKISEKPAEFYVNFGYALLRAARFAELNSVCEQGLGLYPNDLDLMGNQTIALRNLGRLDAAKQSALKRLTLRRDIKAIEEAVDVFHELAKVQRNGDLPAAISNATIEARLIAEGLQVNPGYPPLMLARICLYRFANAREKAMELCCEMVDRKTIHRTYRELAHFHFLEELMGTEEFDIFFDAIEQCEGKIESAVKIELVRELKYTVLVKHFVTAQIEQGVVTFGICEGLRETAFAKHYGMDMMEKDGEGVPTLVQEVLDFFLQKSAESYKYPVMAAKVLEWLGRYDEAVATLYTFLQTHPKDWDGVEAMCLLLVSTGRIQEAVDWAKYFGNAAPWRGKTFNRMSYVYMEAGQEEVARQLREKGTSVSQEEMRLLDDFRNTLATLPWR